MATATVEAPTAPKTDEAVMVTPADAAKLLEQGTSVINKKVAWSAGAGLLPLPLFDMIAVTGVQLKMIADLCDVYGIPFKQSLARPIVVSLIGSLGAGMLAPALAMTAFKLVPGISMLLTGTAMATTSAGITYAVGHLFLEHFRNGGTLENFNLVGGRGIFKAKVQEGIQAAK
ncbi:YcjF family protein [Glaciimonas sp. GNP009]